MKVISKNEYEKAIIKTIRKIGSLERLAKILAVAQTHLKLQNGEV